MKEEIICIQCQGIMEVAETLKKGRNQYTGYRRRRFKCPDCGYVELIFADGRRDIPKISR